MKLIVSKLNVENVVNPPIKPVVKKSFKFSFSILLEKIAIKKPIRKQPSKFEINVPYGIDEVKYLLKERLIINLNNDPSPPPIKTDI
ncbi:MAG: hypothetical protein KatS3mg068_0330 [Candidatus Sericytochromatia bacterium]|nr:MAG: hypothetical protein KatS3mg068_0330 [Candidatus Sericytochromatia bacterium]